MHGPKTMSNAHSRFFSLQGSAARAVLWLIAITLVWRLIEAGLMDLIIGEAYYLASTRSPHLSYFDQPPLFLWMVWVTKSLFHTETPILLRLPFVLMFSASTWTIYRLGARFAGEWSGFAAALLLNASILFTLSIGTWVQPEAPLMLFWLLTVWALADIFFPETGNAAATRPEEMRKWALVGLWLGLTFLSKYHAVFLIAGAGLFALTFAPARRWIWHPGPYLAVAIAALIASPVIVWNAMNEWASFDFQGGRALGTGFHPEWLLRMVLGQIAYISPWIALPVLAAIFLAFIKGPRARFPHGSPAGWAWFLAWLAILPIVFFTAVAAWSDTQFHFHWQAPGYMMGFVLLAGWMTQAWPRRKAWSRRKAWPRRNVLIGSWLAISLVLNFAIMGVVVTHAATGWLRQVLPNGQSFEDPTTSAMKWHDLAAFFEARQTGQNTNEFVAGLSWITCGHIDTALAGRAPLACLSGDPRNIAFNLDLRDLVGKDAVIVDPWNDAPAMQGMLGRFFDRFEPVAVLDMHRNGFPEIRNVHVVRATNFHLRQTVEGGGAPQLSLIRLPRTRIVSVAGQIDLPNSDAPVRLLLDGREIARFAPGLARRETFQIDVRNDPWTVGISNALLNLQTKGSTTGLGLQTVTARLD